MESKTYQGQLTIESYLKKKRMKLKSPLVSEKVSYKFYRISIEERNLYYKANKSMKEWRKTIPFASFIRYIPRIEKQDKDTCDFQYGFQLITTDKKYVLFCKEEETFFNWIRVLEFIFQKKDIGSFEEYKRLQVKSQQKLVKPVQSPNIKGNHTNNLPNQEPNKDVKVSPKPLENKENIPEKENQFFYNHNNSLLIDVNEKESIVKLVLVKSDKPKSNLMGLAKNILPKNGKNEDGEKNDNNLNGKTNLSKSIKLEIDNNNSTPPQKNNKNISRMDDDFERFLLDQTAGKVFENRFAKEVDDRYEFVINDNGKTNNYYIEKEKEKDEWELEGITYKGKDNKFNNFKNLNLNRPLPQASLAKVTSNTAKSNQPQPNSMDNKLASTYADAPTTGSKYRYANNENEIKEKSGLGAYMKKRVSIFDQVSEVRSAKDENVFDQSTLHIKKDLFAEKIHIENLHCGIDDYAKDNIEKPSKNIIVGHTPMKTINKIGFHDEEIDFSNKKSSVKRHKKHKEENYNNLIERMKTTIKKEGKLMDVDKSILGGDDDNCWFLNLRIQEQK